MVYAIVFIGSLLGLCVILGARVMFRQRTIRRFVRSLRQRFASAEERGMFVMEETKVVKPRRHSRASAIELQQVRTLMRSAEKELGQDKYEEAERLLIQALTIHPHAHDVRAELAKLYLTTHRESKAEAMYKELIVHLDEASFHANLGLSYYKQGKYEEACQAYQDALNRDPKNPERIAALGKACIAAQHFEEAAPLIEKASTFLSRDMHLLQLLADCYTQLGDRPKVEETYRRMHKLEPYNTEIKMKLDTLAENQAEEERQMAAAHA